MRSAESKGTLPPSSTRNTEMLHSCLHAEDFLCKMASYPRKKWQILPLASPWTRTRLIRWARTNRQKKKKDRYVSFEVEAASRKKRTRCTICCSRQKSRSTARRLSSVVDLRACGSVLKRLRQQPQSPLLCLVHTSSPYAILSRSWSTTQLATNGAAPKYIGRKVEKKFPARASKHGQSG